MPTLFLDAAAILHLTGVGVVALTLLLIAIGKTPGLAMNRATIAFTGAVLLVAVRALTLDQAFQSVELGTIGLLFALMAVNVNLQEAGFFRVVTAVIVARAGSPRVLLAGIILASGVLSALFLNDTICVMFTPLVLDVALTLRRNPIPYLMGLATASNIGSTATITGNPQNILIGTSSGIPFLEFTRVLGPVALVGMVIAFLVIIVVYRDEFRGTRFTERPEAPRAKDPGLIVHGQVATAVMLVLCVMGRPVAFAAMLAGAIIFVNRRLAADRILAGIDWSLLVFFAGLFVVTGAVGTLGLSKNLFDVAQPIAARGILPLTAVSAVLSNLISNVPAVMLFRPIIPSFPNPKWSWLTLAMATTLAGNLTLLGSVANLIVAETAARKNVKLSFMEYLKAGIPITILTLAFGAAWVGWID